MSDSGNGGTQPEQDHPRENDKEQPERTGDREQKDANQGDRTERRG